MINCHTFCVKCQKSLKKAIFGMNCNYYKKKRAEQKKLAELFVQHKNEILGLLS
jgi:hypothetical protein